LERLPDEYKKSIYKHSSIKTWGLEEYSLRYGMKWKIIMVQYDKILGDKEIDYNH
jgi:hypothetical protein